MITVRHGNERGHTEIEWLDSYHTFSFDRYYDPRHMHFRTLRVINEDRVEPGAGFPTHPHRDMEIITYVLEGSLEHKDSIGTGSVIRPGEVQKMSAGSGISHSEYNPSKTEPVHLLQIWIMPEERGIEPGYEQKSFDLDVEARDRLRLVASRDGSDDTIRVHQDVSLYAGRLSAGKQVSHQLKAGRHAWIQVARGEVEVSGQRLKAGDGAAVSDEERLEIEAVGKEAEVLLFDLA
jgi:quercetin 2,3-dioxygenase